MSLSLRFLITGLKKAHPKRSWGDIFRCNITQPHIQQDTSVFDSLKDTFNKSVKSANVTSQPSPKQKKLASSLFIMPEVSFYSENFVNKFLSILESKGCKTNIVNPNKIPKFLYHITSKSNYEKMIEFGGIKPAKEGLCGENIFMLDIKNFFKRWTKYNSAGGSHQKRLLAKVSGKNHEDVVLLKIPTKNIDRNKLGIRSQDVLYDWAENLGTVQVDFMKKYNCATEEDLLQLIEADELAFNQFANIFKRYLHLTKGTSAGNQRLFTTRKDAIEYIYPEIIDIKNVEKIGQINPSEFKLTSKFNPDKPMQRIFRELLNGQPEQKGALLMQC